MKNKNQIPKSKLKTRGNELIFLNFFSFLMGFQMILASYVTSALLQKVTGLENVGGFFFLVYLFSFLLIINLHHIVRKLGKGKVFISAVSIKLLALLAIGLLADRSLVVLFVMISLFIGPIAWVGLDLLVETFSKDKITGSIRGRFLTIMNMGCFLAPFLATFLIEKSGYLNAPFLLSAFLVFIVLILAFFKFFHFENDFKKDLSVRKVLQKMLKRKNILRIYFISFLLEFFYAIMIIHVPLFLLQNNLTWKEIGEILTIMLFPFIVIQYPLGIMADKKWGEKEGLLVGILVMAITSILMVVPVENGFFYWMAILFVSRIGASMVELLRDAYFYKKVNANDVDIIDFFRTTRSVAYIIAGFISFLYLSFFSIEGIFVLLGLIIFLGVFPVLKLKDTL